MKSKLNYLHHNSLIGRQTICEFCYKAGSTSKNSIEQKNSKAARLYRLICCVKFKVKYYFKPFCDPRCKSS